MKPRPWLPGELDTLRAMYADTPTERIADLMGRSLRSVYSRAKKLGLRKSREYYQVHAAGRLQKLPETGKECRFKPGQTPWNKGKKGWKSGGRSAETRFKPGRLPHLARNYQPIGTLRINKDGVLERKVTDDQSIYPARRWAPVTRLVWEAAHGPIPENHVVRFKDGMHTTIEAEITVNRLEMLSRSENMRRNSYHTNYPKEVAEVIQLRGALTRKIRNREEEAHAEQDR